MAPSPQVVSAKAKEHWPTYISNMKPKDVHGVWVSKFISSNIVAGQLE